MQAEEINSLQRNSASGCVIKYSCIIIHLRSLFYPSSTIPSCIAPKHFLEKKSQEFNQDDKHLKSANTNSAFLETFPVSRCTSQNPHVLILLLQNISWNTALISSVHFLMLSMA